MSTIRADTIIDSTGGNTAKVNGLTVSLASQAQAEAGTDNAAFMTALRSAQAITALGGTNAVLQVFTASGTYTPTAGYKKALIFCTGGGEGGGACSSANGDTGFGGASGATAIALADISSGTARAVTVGAGGGSPLVDGGTTSVATLCSASGGGATYAVTGNLGVQGAAGGSSNNNTNFGGASFWGGGAQAGTANLVGNNAVVYGSGGGGALSTGTARAGGSGASGVVMILEFKS